MKYTVEIRDVKCRRCKVSVEASDADEASDIAYNEYASGKYEKRMKADNKVDDVEIEIV